MLPVVDGFAGVSLSSLFLIPLFRMNGLYLARRKSMHRAVSMT